MLSRYSLDVNTLMEFHINSNVWNFCRISCEKETIKTWKMQIEWKNEIIDEVKRLITERKTSSIKINSFIVEYFGEILHKIHFNWISSKWNVACGW